MRMLMVVAVVLAGAAATATAPDDHESEVLEWRQERHQRLMRPDGWLSLVGLHWLAEGGNRVGAAPDNDIVLDKGPGHVGDAILADGGVRFCPAADAEIRVDGESASECRAMTPDVAGEPTTVTFDSISFYLIDRAGHLALRVKDSRADTLSDFEGMEYFPVSAEWRVRAVFEPHDSPRAIDVPDITGIVQELPNPGRLVFDKDGSRHSLDAVHYEGSDEFFLIFADRTNGRVTYGGGRYVYTPLPDDEGRVWIDFNKAYNPPCVFTEYATCPLPPPQNRLDLAITAGEKMYGEADY